MTTMRAVQDFLAQPTLAMVGVSHAADDFSRDVYRELRRTHTMVPVHPKAVEIEGDHAVRALCELPPEVGGLLVMTNPQAAEALVDEAVEVGIPRVWLYKGAGRGSSTQHAVQVCEDHGVEVVDGQCPLMFLDPVPRRCSACAVGKRVVGTYPS